MRKIVLGLAALVAFTLTSCGTFPQAEIDSAKAAIEAAAQAEAEKYLPAEFAAAQDSLNAAIELANVAKSKFLFKNYKTSVAKLVAVVPQSEQVAAAAVAKKAEVKAEVETLLVSSKEMVDAVKALFAKAPKGKDGKAALEAISADITAIEAAVTESETLYNGGDYMSALTKLKGASEKGAAITEELNAAIQKTRR